MGVAKTATNKNIIDITIIYIEIYFYRYFSLQLNLVIKG